MPNGKFVIAALTRDTLREVAVEDYDAAHRAVPEGVYTAIEAAGVTDWTIWRDGVDLFQLIVCEDWNRARLAIEEATPGSWRERMSALVDLNAPTWPTQIVTVSWTLRIRK